MSKIMISCQNISFTYPGSEKTALDDISLDIEQGEFVTVIGANGSGKSTLAKMLNALLLPDAGTVTVSGTDTKSAESAFLVRQTVGMVFQNPDNQLVATVVEEDVAFGPENLGVPSAEIRRVVDDSLAKVDMSEYRLHAPHLLSGGQKQRVAIAGILAINPPVIVFDEATAMLDPAGKRDVMNIIQALHREGITIIHITHNLDEIIFSDRTLIMHEGKCVSDTSPREVLSMSSEKLARYNLELPQISSLAQGLLAAGLPVAGAQTVSELVAKLCP